MEKYSEGPVVDIVLLFLASFAGKDSGIIVDGIYGETGVKWMRMFQATHGLFEDGGCGPETRRFLKEHFGVDLEVLVQRYSGPSRLVQPNGKVIEFPSGKVLDYTASDLATTRKTATKSNPIWDRLSHGS